MFHQNHRIDPVSDCFHISLTEQHVRGGETREHAFVSCEHGSKPRAGAAVYFWDGGLGTLPGPASAPVWLQVGVRQPETSHLWPPASRSSGTLHELVAEHEDANDFFLIHENFIIVIDY